MTTGAGPGSGSTGPSWFSHLLSGPRPYIALALLQVAIALVVWSPFPAGVWHDDGVYLLLGRSVALGEGLRYHGIAGAYPAPKFPPLFPWMLAGLWSVLSDVGAVTLAAGILNLAFVGAGCLCFFQMLRVLGLGSGPAVGLAALAWLPVGIWRSALVPFSEPLFLLLLSGGLALSCAFERRLSGSGGAVAGTGTSGRGGGRPLSMISTWILMTLTLLVAIHVRTVGVALLGAVGVALWSRGGGRAALGTLGVVVGGMIPWVVWSSLATSRIPEVLRDVLGSYGGWLVHQVTEYPSAFLASLHPGAVDLLDRVLAVLLPAPPSWEAWIGDARLVGLVFLLPAFFLGLDRIWPRSRTLVLTFFFYLSIVWLWPFQATRLLVPVLPILVLVVAAGFFLPTQAEAEAEGGGEGEGDAPEVDRPGGQQRPLPPGLMRVWRGLGVAWVVVFAGISSWNLATGWAGAGYRVNAGALARTVQAVREATPAGAVVGAPEFWASLPLHANRVGAPSARFLPVRPPSEGPSWGTAKEQHRIWALTGIEYLVLEQRGTIHGEALDAVVEACGPESVRRLASWPEGRLVRLDWDSECRSRLGLPLDLTFQRGVDPLVGPAAQE